MLTRRQVSSQVNKQTLTTTYWGLHQLLMQSPFRFYELYYELKRKKGKQIYKQRKTKRAIPKGTALNVLCN